MVAALETGRSSWTAVTDAVRLGPTDDTTAVTATQLRGGGGTAPAVVHGCCSLSSSVGVRGPGEKAEGRKSGGGSASPKGSM